jgi:hypothetical protein
MVLVRKPEGNRPLGRPRPIWKENIKMDLQKWDVGVWTGLAASGWRQLAELANAETFGFHKMRGIS